jgi:hypothetical protein
MIGYTSKREEKKGAVGGEFCMLGELYSAGGCHVFYIC